MPKCSHCGKPCDSRNSFNWKYGVRYLCSDNDTCEKESRSWRLTKKPREKGMTDWELENNEQIVKD